ncbi:MAG: uracil-DNA glycosylase family protein [Actinomycetota bacterium]
MTDLLAQVRSCTVCAEHLAEGPRPIVQLAAGAPIVIIGQAPGRRVHHGGVPWDDPSGDRLRQWLGIDPDRFYDPALVAIVPMGLCYPGRGSSGDKPPRPECAPLWHDALLAHLPTERLEIIVGAHAQARYVPDRPSTLTETVAQWRHHLPGRIVLPHPSPRNNGWLAANPWFAEDVVPAVRARVADLLSGVTLSQPTPPTP